MAELVKVTVNLLPEASAVVEASAAAEECSRTDVINRALLLYAAVAKAEPGMVLTVTNRDGTTWKQLVAR